MIVEKTLVYFFIIAALTFPTVLIAILARAVMKAMARNPAASTWIFWGMVLMLIAIEGMVITSIMIVFRLFIYES